MNDIAKGGRGKQAPYKTMMCRTPEPIKFLVEELAANYRELISDYQDPEDPALIAATLEAIAAGEKLDEQAIILKAMDRFIERQRQAYGSNGAQKGKEFTLETRNWDYFRKFRDLVSKGELQ